MLHRGYQGKEEFPCTWDERTRKRRLDNYLSPHARGDEPSVDSCFGLRIVMHVGMTDDKHHW